MEIARAQSDVRRIYRGGFSGPLVAAIIWAASNAVFTWISSGAGMVVLFFGGMLIFPLSALILKLMGGPTALPKGHPSIGLAMQSAFTVPIGLLVALALGSADPQLFFPASLIIVGAHYLVFISLYGMKLYAVLAGVLIVIGAGTMFWMPSLGDVNGWIGAGVFLVFTVLLYRAPGETVGNSSH